MRVAQTTTNHDRAIRAKRVGQANRPAGRGSKRNEHSPPILSLGKRSGPKHGHTSKDISLNHAQAPSPTPFPAIVGRHDDAMNHGIPEHRLFVSLR